ncbi:MAG TPA: winged helix DNA-binding domain-containing protein [Pyrinomonadaceae bacterium]|nr:winged helix DNA-binding domain-containing protein [Pyrinomonadaceae bacterium]
MTDSNVARIRLHNQGVASPRFDEPSEVVRWFGAVQAQDYLGSLWALGLRTRRATEASVERAIARRSIVRTWPLRGTLHFVAAEDVRWMLRLSGGRTVARAAGRYRQLELDEATFTKSMRVLARSLEGGRQLTRAELADALEQSGIATGGQRLIHILNRSALEGLTCYAARRGKQFTFALLDEWAPSSGGLPTREESLAELAGRYFESRGPATLQDFVWWSGLTTTDARAGLEAARPRLRREVFGGQTYWLSASASAPKDESPSAQLLPAFDEYTVAYKDRAPILHPSHVRRADAATAILGPAVVVNGLAIGTWKRTLRKDSVLIETRLWATVRKAERQALDAAARRYGDFLGLAASY